MYIVCKRLTRSKIIHINTIRSKLTFSRKMFNFEGKTALVTGASNGIGRDIAIKLAECGAKVIAIGRSRKDLESLKNEIDCTIIQLDLSDWDKTRAALKNLPTVDLLVNNAGETLRKSLADTTIEDINRILDTNFKSVVNLTQMVVKNLVEEGKRGAIVNVSSLCGLIGVINHCAYSSSKGAMDAFTRAVAVEQGPNNIRINSVNPTVIMSPMGESFCTDIEKFKKTVEGTPLGRLGQVREVSWPVLFLLSDMASMITGVCLPIDGGYMIY